jgi:2-polyprenyl-3-methyl-5-hydroxy-6-metoxy-1,4-benzoquinol methylase
LRSALVYDNDVDPSQPNNAHSFAVDMVGSNKRVLEVGCAAGHVTRILASRGCDVTGIEVDASAARSAEEHAREVLVADLDVDDYMAKLEDQVFDVVLLGDVLEHLRDPLHAMRSFKKLVEPHGYIVASLPNIAHVDVRLALLQGRFQYGDWGLLDRTHLRFFTRTSGEQLLRDAGLLPVEVRRVFVPAFESEIPVDRSAVETGVLDGVLRDPEAETYQFVWRAIPDNGVAATRELATRCQYLDDELQKARIHIGFADAAAFEVADRCLELEGQRIALESEVQALRDEIVAIENTKLMRHTRRLRAVYRERVLRQ